MSSAPISAYQRDQRSIFKMALAFLLVAITLVGLAAPALAIGPGTGGSKIRVNDERIGPYSLLIATSPLPVTLDQQLSVWVRVTDPTTNALRRDSEVMVAATHRESGQTLTAEATHQNAGNDYDYVAHFDVEDAGQWEITVNVSDEPGEAEVAFVESVASGLSLKIVAALGIPFLVLAIALGVYLWQRSGAEPQLETPEK